MNSRLKDYLINTILGQIFFILVLSPWFIFIIGMSFEQYITWLWQGSLIGLVLPHGMIMWVGFWKKRFVQHSWKVSWLLAQVAYTKNTSTISTTSTFARLSVVLGSLGGDIYLVVEILSPPFDGIPPTLPLNFELDSCVVEMVKISR